MNTQEQIKRKKYRLDIIVIAAVLLLSILLFLILFFNKEPGNMVKVEVDGTVVGTYSLSEDGSYPLNGGTNVLVIEKGTARLVESQCPDHTCEQMGKVRYVGQTIVCLPNRVTVTVTGESNDSVDFVS